jgi:ATP-binding cassette subfamily B protein
MSSNEALTSRARGSGVDAVFIRLLKRFRWIVVGYIGMGVLQSFLAFLGLVYFQRLLDRITGVRAFPDLYPTLLVYVAITIVNYLLIYLNVYPHRFLSTGIYQWAKVLAMRKIARIDYRSYQDLGTGKLVQLVENGAAATRDILFGFYLLALRGLVPSVVFSLLFTGIYDKSTMVLVLGGYVVAFVVLYFLLKHLRKKKEKVLAQEEDFSRFSVRGFMELVVFRINRRFPREIARVEALADSIAESNAQMGLINELFFTLAGYVRFGIVLGMTVFQVRQIIAGNSTVGTLVALVSFVHEATMPIADFNVRFADYKLNLVTFKRFAHFLALPDDANVAKGRRVEIRKGEIALRDVSFSYGENTILQDLTLAFEGGKSTALVGTTGSGKSTIAKLVLSLLKPDKGAISVDGQDVSEIDLDSYYRHVAYISQDAPVFDGTLRENLVFDSEIPDKEVLTVLGKVSLKELVESWPDGLDAEIGERGIKLSGGERQRLAFGRVFFQNPDVLVLDEPTSALDSATEEFVTNNMLELFQGKTTIIIAHRLQTVRNVDRILVFEGGQIIQDGVFDELVNAPGKFQELWVTQTQE